jgi:hypothetical protein
MSLDRPIFIVGTGRCGSTIMHRIFTHHPRVTFLSGLCLLYPDQPKYNGWAMQLMDVPLLRRHARKRFRPAEHWPFRDHYVRGFNPARVVRQLAEGESRRERLVDDEQYFSASAKGPGS